MPEARQGVGAVVLSILENVSSCHLQAPLQVGAHRILHLLQQTAHQYTTCGAGSAESEPANLEGEIILVAPSDQQHKLIHCEELKRKGQIPGIAE